MGSRPKRIAVSHSVGILTIEWQDGSSSKYPISSLRAACPCAECRAGKENQNKPTSSEMLEIPVINQASTDLVGLEQVGNYGIQLHWKDGHSYGIYTWEYLRNLCPEMQEDP
jgi:DUF971 family protein